MLKEKIPIETVIAKLSDHIKSENPVISMKAISEYLDRVYGKAQQTMAVNGEMTTTSKSVMELLDYKNMTKDQKTYLIKALDKTENGK